MASPSQSKDRIAVLQKQYVCLTFMRMGNTITIRLPEDLDHWLEEQSRITGLPKGRIVREQLERSRTETRRQPFLDLAGGMEGDPGLSQKRGFSKSTTAS